MVVVVAKVEFGTQSGHGVVGIESAVTRVYAEAKKTENCAVDIQTPNAEPVLRRQQYQVRLYQNRPRSQKSKNMMN